MSRCVALLSPPLPPSPPPPPSLTRARARTQVLWGSLLRQARFTNNSAVNRADLDNYLKYGHCISDKGAPAADYAASCAFSTEWVSVACNKSPQHRSLLRIVSSVWNKPYCSFCSLQLTVRERGLLVGSRYPRLCLR